MPKPSYGCMVCQSRRVKCDLRAAKTCLNCERYGADCPGYPSQVDVVFRQHRVQTIKPSQRVSLTSSAVGKFCKEQHSGSGSTVKASSRCDTYDSNQKAIMATDMNSILHLALPLDMESIALARYYSAYCVYGSFQWPSEHMQSLGNGCLFAALQVLGLDSIERSGNMSNSSYRLRRQYVGALQLLNAALQSPTEAIIDSTLIATLLMSQAETRLSATDSLNSWNAHALGLAALLELRGVEQVSTCMGATLFLQVSSHLFASCLYRGRSVPKGFKTVAAGVKHRVVDLNHPLWRYFDIMMRLVDFAASTPRVFSNRELRQETTISIVSDALSFFHALSTLFDNVSSIWQYRIIQSTECPDYVGYEHVYESFTTASLWNGTRTATMVLFDIITRATPSCADRYQHNLSANNLNYVYNAAKIMSSTASEIIAAVPQHMAYYTAKFDDLDSRRLCKARKNWEMTHVVHYNPFEQTKPDSQQIPYLVMSGGCKFHWPLYFAAKCSGMEDKVKMHLVQVLENIGFTIRLGQATSLAATLRSQAAQYANDSKGAIDKSTMDAKPLAKNA